MSKQTNSPNDLDYLQTMTAGQIGQALQISKRTLMRLVKAGTFPAPIMVGRQQRWTVQQILDFYTHGGNHTDDCHHD